MSYIISGDAGHNCNPGGGAMGIRYEDDLTREVIQAINTKLESIGYSFVDCTPYGMNFSSVSAGLSYRCKMANNSASGIHLCVHFNAGGGHGVEVFAIGATTEARNICNEIAKLGYSNRGVKDGSHLYVLNHTNMRAVLIECCFIDSQEDMNRYNADKLADAIIKAVTGVTVPQPSTEVPYPGYLLKYNPTKFDANVKLIQQKLFVTADGYFGDNTKRIVKVFQTSRGLTADGIVGSLTWNKIFN